MYWLVLHLQMKEYFLPVYKILEKPYFLVLGYPTATKEQIKSRYNEIKRLCIESVSFFGDTKINTINILGKGHNGIVILAKRYNKKIAIKIKRVDSHQQKMYKEYNLLKIANNIDVGPKIIDCSENFIIMEYLDGKTINKWMNKTKNKHAIKNTIKKILFDCYKLDSIGMDHGELSNMEKHVIVGKSKTTIIDFENASIERKTSNVTSATQSIYMRSSSPTKIKNYKISKIELIESLRMYKHDITSSNFEQVLKVLKIY